MSTSPQPQSRKAHEDDGRDRLIRERAYYIWEHEGRPEGRHFEHWQRAVAHIEEEEGTGPWLDRAS